MPQRALRPCNKAGCDKLTRDKDGYCDDHKYVMEEKLAAKRRRFDKNRGSSYSRGYDHKWRKLRKYKIERDPLCEECKENGKLVPADEVHHIEPIKERPDLRLKLFNLKSLCIDCHNKTK